MSDKIDKVLSRKGVLAAEFLSDSYRISGEVILKGQPLVDMLNDKMSSYIRAENVYVSPINDPSVFKAQYGYGQLRKDKISMIVLAREEDGVARHTLYHSQTAQSINFSMFATVSNFEIRGGLRLGSLVDVDNMLMQSVDRFITIYRAMATITTQPEIQFNGGAILLNRELVTIFCIDKTT